MQNVASYHDEYNSNRGHRAQFGVSVFLTGNIAAMVTCYIKRTRLPMIGNMYDTGIATSFVKQL